jgi:undecaprenyl pyrophosphate phosphatase UppP
VAGSGTLGPELVIGTLVAAVSGYGAISLLIKALARHGLWPFAVYCLAAGSFTLIRL